jgi:hypothetical protein
MRIPRGTQRRAHLDNFGIDMDSTRMRPIKSNQGVVKY